MGEFGWWLDHEVRALMNGINALIKKTLESSLIPSAMCVCMLSCSVMSDFLLPLGLQPTRLLCPWNSPGKNTGVGCHALLQGIFLSQGSNLHASPATAGGFYSTEPPGKSLLCENTAKSQTSMNQEVGPFPLNLLVP